MSRSTSGSPDQVEDNSRRRRRVRFAKKLVSDVFYVERLDRRTVAQLFYSESDVIRFQLDDMRKGKKRRLKSSTSSSRRRKSNDQGISIPTTSSSRSRRETSDEERNARKRKEKSRSKNKTSTAASVPSTTTTHRRLSNSDVDDHVARDEESAIVSSASAHSKPKSSSSRKKKRSSSSALLNAKPVSPSPSMTLWQSSSSCYLDDSDRLDKIPTASLDFMSSQDVFMAQAKDWEDSLSTVKTDDETLTTPDESMASLQVTTDKSISNNKNGEQAALDTAVSSSLYSWNQIYKQKKQQDEDSLSLDSATESMTEEPEEDYCNEMTTSSSNEESLSESSMEFDELIAERTSSSQNDLVAQAIARRKQKIAKEISPLSRLRGIAKAIMVTQSMSKDTTASF